MRNYDAEELFKFVTEMTCDTTIGRRNGNEDSKTLHCPMGELPLVSLDRVLRYGFQRFVNDKVGGDDKTMAVKVEMAQAIVADLMEGNVSKRRVGESADPMVRFRINALREVVASAQWKAINKADNADEIIVALLEKHAEALEPRALELKKIEDDKKAGAAKITLALDLSSLGLK